MRMAQRITLPLTAARSRYTGHVPAERTVRIAKPVQGVDACPPTATALPAGTKIRQWEVIRTLGRGGMGHVYLARDLLLGRRVAIKFLIERQHDTRPTLLDEARATASCQHENIVIVHDVDEYQGYGMPVYARGIAQQSVRGRSSCAGYGIPVKLGGVTVRPGDFILADMNGTVVVPHERVAEVLAFAQKVKATEEGVIAAIRAGADPMEAHQRVNYDNMLKATA